MSNPPIYEDLLQKLLRGPHVRAIVGRGGFREAVANDSVDDIRDIATPTYVIFPNTIFVAQPGFVSRATAYPTSLDGVYWEHEEAPIQWWHEELARRIEELP
jgi:hypothetical protein